MFTVSIRDEVPRALSGLLRQAQAALAGGRRINAAVGRAGQQLTRDHLYELAESRHRPGVGLNFYEDAGDAVSHRDLGGAVELRIDKAGVAQRFYGGTIRAVNYSHLWIPVAPESEGKSAGEFNDLVPIISPLTNKGVAINDAGKVLFALVEELTQEEDPSVLPTSDEYATVTVDAIEKLIDRLLRQDVETSAFAPPRSA